MIITETLPELFTPTKLKKEGLLCPAAEKYLSNCRQKLNGQLPSDWRIERGLPKGALTTFRLLGCLEAKTYQLVAGLCTRDKFFPNGTIFEQGRWYLLRDSNSLRYQLTQLAQLAEDSSQPLSGLDYNLPGPQVARDFVLWENCGGIWEPVRKYNQSLTPRERLSLYLEL